MSTSTGGVGTEDLADPPVAWRGSDTAIQATGVNRDFGIFDDPDAFYAAQVSNLAGIKAFLFRRLVRHAMNRKVAKIRAGGKRVACVASAPQVDSSGRVRRSEHRGT